MLMNPDTRGALATTAMDLAKIGLSLLIEVEEDVEKGLKLGRSLV